MQSGGGSWTAFESMNPFESVDLWLINLATVRVVHISNEGPLVRGQESRRGTDLLISPLPKIGFTDVN